MTCTRAGVRVLLAVALSAVGCEDALVEAPRDAGAMTDGATPDAPMDASSDAADTETDAGDVIDAGAFDGGPTDLGGTDAGPSPDGGTVEPVTPVAPRPVTSPAPPAIPWVSATDDATLDRAAPPDLLLPCPWRVVAAVADGDPLATCEPWPESGADLACAAGTAHFPGESGCARVGSECAATWPDPPAGTVRYVSATATAGGDGSMSQPFARIADALASPPAGSLVVLVAAGTYDETIVRSTGNVTLVGACSERTRIAGTATTVALRITGGTTTLRDLTAVGIDLSAGTVTLDGVVIDAAEAPAATLAALRATGGTVTASNVHVHDAAVGVALSSGAHATLDRIVVEDTTGAGIELDGLATELDLAHASIRDTGSSGIRNGSTSTQGGVVTMRAVVVERAREDAVRSFGAGSSLDGEDIVVRDTSLAAGDGFGVNVRRDASVVLRRVLVERNRERAVHAGEGVLELHGAVIRDTSAAGDGTLGVGAQVYFGSQALFDRVYVARSATAGILVEGDDTRLEMNDVVVRGVRTTSGEPYAAPLVVRGGAVRGSRVLLAGGRGRTLGLAMNPTSAGSVPPSALVEDAILMEAATVGTEAPATIDVAHGRATLRRALVRAGVGDGATASSTPPGGVTESLVIEDATFEGTADGSRTGVRAQGSPAVVLLRRMSITGFQSAATARDGASLSIEDLTAREMTWGLRCRAASRLSVERADIAGFTTAGILVGDIGSRVTGSDIVVGPPSASAEPTASLGALERSSLELERVHVTGARGVGVGAFGYSASITLRDARVDGTTADDDGAASSVGAYTNAVLSIDSFVLSDGGICGVQVADGGGADLVRGEVGGHDFGACVYSGFVESRVTAEVLYTDNDAPISRAMEPVPAAPDTGP